MSTKSPKNPKILILEQEIDKNRVLKNYQELQENVAKYHRKYYTQGSVLGYVALAEVVYSEPDIPYDDDVVVPSDPIFLDKVHANLQKALSCAPDASTNGLAMLQCQIWLAYVDYLNREFASAYGTIKDCDIAAVKELQQSDLIVQTTQLMYYSVTALIYNALNEKDLGFKVLEEAAEYISKLNYGNSNAKMLHYWSEMCLHLFVVKLLNRSYHDRAYQITSLYLEKHNLKADQPPSLKGISILYHHIAILVRKLDEPQPFTGIPLFNIYKRSQLGAGKEACIKQIKAYLPTYEKLVTSLCPFPKGENQDAITIARHKRVLKAYDWYVHIEMCQAHLYDNGIGDVVDKQYKLLEILYRGTTHSFHALNLMRYICHTFFMLIYNFGDKVCRDEKMEALNAVQAYVFHWEKQFTLELDIRTKEQRDKSAKNSTIQKPYLSHRLSGQLTQLPEFASPAFSPNLADIVDQSLEDLDLPRISMTNLGDIPAKRTKSKRDSSMNIETLIVIPEVDGETVPDVIGVLITGIRLILHTHDGDLGLLKQAQAYGEKAFIIITEHGSHLPNYSLLLSRVFQWLGIVYGELALDVIGREERLDYQTEAVLILRKAKELDKNNSRIRFQLALQLAEIGEFEEAIDEVNHSLNLSPHSPGPYNLLALLLSSKDHHDKGLEVANAGWKSCMKEHLFVAPGSEKTDQELLVDWDSVDIHFKEEILNLRLTQISLEMELYPPEVVLEHLQKTFALVRRMSGLTPEPKKEEPTQLLGRHQSITGHHSTQPERRGSQIPITERAGSVVLSKSYSVSNISVFRGHVMYEMQIILWLSVSAVYRSLQQFENAANAIEEAEKVLTAFSAAQHKIMSQTSRVYRDSDIIPSSPALGRPRQDSFANNSTKLVNQLNNVYWNDKNTKLAKFQSDIGLEKAFLLYDTYTAQIAPKPVEKYIKYLSPIARVEFERRSLQRQQQRTYPRFSSVQSADSISISNTLMTESGTNNVEINDEVASNEIRHIHSPEHALQEEKSELTLQQVIDAAQFALLFDSQNLPARAFLGSLLKQQKDYSESEHHLQKACTQQRHRSSSSGKSGGSSIYGGATSKWGWNAWKLLAELLKEQGRTVDAEKAALYAVELEGVCCLRGYECIERFK
ncbi:Tetratricopeptide repeat protein 7A [Boothiomyces sp. JEL0866]|nr:Tetratricopeptide repeat protein 7A [Boothiomyces sp. JEL0866]